MANKNAKEELLNHVKGKPVTYLKIKIFKDRDEPIYFEGGLEDDLSTLDVEYDSGFGGQELFGYIWYADGSWSERWEYDGSEGWAYKECPPMSIKISYDAWTI